MSVLYKKSCREQVRGTAGCWAPEEKDEGMTGYPTYDVSHTVLDKKLKPMQIKLINYRDRSTGSYC
jgi:hypothetical protein